jgi:hypothetical protein
MKYVLNACGAAIVFAAALATPSIAAITVEPGVYVFQAADTSTQTITVTVDGNGKTAVTSLGLGFIEPCRVSGTEAPYTLQSSWGLGGDYVISPTGKVKFSALYNYFTFDVSLDFGAGGTATGGTIASYGVTLYPDAPFSVKPTKALLCESASQAMTLLSFTAPGAVPAISAAHSAKFIATAE